MIGVVRIDPDVMVVNVLRSFAETPQRPAAIIRDHQKNVHLVNAIDVFWVGDYARVVHRAGIKLVASFPAATAIIRAKDAALAISRRDCQSDAAHFRSW